jgi:aryl-alcohol dehydrogenase-like predicted oxidoreductase
VTIGRRTARSVRRREHEEDGVKQRTLGKSGYRVSEIGLGCWQLGNDFGPVSDEAADAVLGAADACAIDFWDTADVYGDGLSESRIGRHRAERPGERVVATKVGRAAGLYPDGYTKANVRSSLEGSLRRLGGDALDLVQLHCVPSEVLRTGDLLSWLDEFRDAGLLREFGASVETVDEALFAVGHPTLTSIQIIFSLVRQDAIEDVLPAAQASGVGVIVRLPLASGVLSGTMTKSQRFSADDHRNYNRDGAAFNVGETFSGLPFERAVEIADHLAALAPPGMTTAQMALRWILDQPAVSTVIAGATRPEQVLENAAVSELDPLPAELHRQLADYYATDVRQHVRGAI